LSDVVLAQTVTNVPASDIQAIGEVLRWYAFGNNAEDTLISKVFPSLKVYDRIVERCLTKDEKLRFHTVGELSSMANMQQDYNPETLLQEFSLICRKNFPKELPEFVHCTDQKKIAKLFADFAARICLMANFPTLQTKKRVHSPLVLVETVISSLIIIISLRCWIFGYIVTTR
jgi:hypothetical protein